MLKLLNVDAEGERALRIVSYFDQLTQHRPDFGAVVRSTAILADCTAGLLIPGTGALFRFNEEGESLPPDPQASISTFTDLETFDSTTSAGRVWLERLEGPRTLDDFILERMALTVAGVIERRNRNHNLDSASGLADPALAELLVNDRANEEERSRAARLMGFEHDRQIQIAAISSSGLSALPPHELGRRLQQAWSARVEVVQMSTNISMAIAVVTSTPVGWTGVGLDIRAALGSPVDLLNAPRAWSEARSALRFAGLGSSWPQLMQIDMVGAVGMLAGVDPTLLKAHPDVRAIQAYSESSSGQENLAILEVYLHAESLRAAARSLNFHHSSLQMRISKLEKELAMPLQTGIQRYRAATAVLMWQLSNR